MWSPRCWGCPQPMGILTWFMEVVTWPHPVYKNEAYLAFKPNLAFHTFWHSDFLTYFAVGPIYCSNMTIEICSQPVGTLMVLMTTRLLRIPTAIRGVDKVFWKLLPNFYFVHKNETYLAGQPNHTFDTFDILTLWLTVQLVPFVGCSFRSLRGVWLYPVK